MTTVIPSTISLDGTALELPTLRPSTPEAKLFDVLRSPQGEVVKITGVSASREGLRRYLTTITGDADRWIRAEDLVGWTKEDPAHWEDE